MNKTVICFLLTFNFLFCQECYKDYTTSKMNTLSHLKTILNSYQQSQEKEPSEVSLKFIDFTYIIIRLSSKKVKVRITIHTTLPPDTEVSIEIWGKSVDGQEFTNSTTKTVSSIPIELEGWCGKFKISVKIKEGQKESVQKVLKQYENAIKFSEKEIDASALCSDTYLENIIIYAKNLKLLNDKCNPPIVNRLSHIFTEIEEVGNLYCSNISATEYKRCKNTCSNCKEPNYNICNECILLAKNDIKKLETLLYIKKYFKNIVNYNVLVDKVKTYYDILSNFPPDSKVRGNVCRTVNLLLFHNESRLKALLRKVQIEYIYHNLEILFYSLCRDDYRSNNSMDRIPLVILDRLGKCAQF